MLEAGVVINMAGEPVFWHTPPGRHAGGLPDSNELWEVLWDNRHNLYGVAHTHPGSGVPGPSYSDVTTFAAVEAALGRRHEWPILSADRMVVCSFVGPHKLTYAPIVQTNEPAWVGELRRLSE
jgi:hypothetical protein